MGQETEIVVVDDGSTDRTAELARAFKLENLKVIRYEKRQGKGMALRTGLRHAGGQVAVILDADCTCSSGEIPAIIKPILDGKADFVTGTRFVYAMEKKAMKSSHLLANKISAWIVSLYLGRRITDSLCGLKAFKKAMLMGKLEENSWPDFELLIEAKKNNLRIMEVPVHYLSRKAGISKMKTFWGCFHMPRLLIKSLIKP